MQTAHRIEHSKINVATVLGHWPAYLILFFLQDKDDITWLNARCLVSFSSKGNFLTVLHAFIHMYLKNLYLLHNFFALTFFTAVFFTDDFAWRGSEIMELAMCAGHNPVTQKGRSLLSLTFTVTIGAHRLHLLDHAWGQLSDHDAHATPPTCCTFLDSTCLATLSAYTHTQKGIVRN